MPLYSLNASAIEPVSRRNFAELGIKERGDLQRLLKDAIEVVAPDTLVLAEEFSEWADSKRRIDLLGLDGDGNLVVIELKRTDDGGHMDLQALRYAAMVSVLTFERIVEIYSKTLAAQKKQGDAMAGILDHLGWASPDEGQIATNVRIVLVSADFSKEITTSVLWLNDQGLDITCIRLTSYEHAGGTLLDVQQVLPLPEAADYTVKLREKTQEARSNLLGRSRNYDKFIVTTGPAVSGILGKGRAILTMVRFLAKNGISPDELQESIGQKKLARFYKIEGVVRTEAAFLEKAAHSSEVNSGKVFDPVRWFTEDENLMSHEGYTYVFSNQWGQWTEVCMNRLVEIYAKFGISFRRSQEETAG